MRPPCLPAADAGFDVLQPIVVAVVVAAIALVAVIDVVAVVKCSSAASCSLLTTTRGPTEPATQLHFPFAVFAPLMPLCRHLVVALDEAAVQQCCKRPSVARVRSKPHGWQNTTPSSASQLLSSSSSPSKIKKFFYSW